MRGTKPAAWAREKPDCIFFQEVYTLGHRKGAFGMYMTCLHSEEIGWSFLASASEEDAKQTLDEIAAKLFPDIPAGDRLERALETVDGFHVFQMEAKGQGDLAILVAPQPGVVEMIMFDSDDLPASSAAVIGKIPGLVDVTSPSGFITDPDEARDVIEAHLEDELGHSIIASGNLETLEDVMDRIPEPASAPSMSM